jgi:hypothetical protein
MLHILLLKLVFLDLDSLVEPLRVSDSWDWIHATLESHWNSDDLLDGAAKSLLVVIPIKDTS